MHIAAAVASVRPAAPWLAQNGHALWVGAGIVLVLIAVLLALGMTGKAKSHKLGRALRALIVGQDNRASTSKTITFAWTAAVAWMLVTETLRDLAANVRLGDLPVSGDYLLLLGGPFAAAVLAKGIVVSRLTNGTLIKTPAPADAPLNLGDIVSADDGSVDLVDFQYTMFNLIALGIVVFTFAKHPANGLPAVPSGLLAITSASAGTYVGNKAVTSSVPSITRFTPGVVRSGQAVTISGTNLMSTASDAENPTVTIGGMPAPILGSPSASSLMVRVPFGLPAKAGGTQTPVSVVADSSGNSSAQGELMVRPDEIDLTQVTPSAPPPGSTITLYGSGLLAAQAIPPQDTDVPADPPVVVVQDAGDGHELTRISPDGHGPAPADNELSVVFPALNVSALTPLLVSVARGALTSSPERMLLGAGPVQPINPGTSVAPRQVDGSQGFGYGSGVCTLNATMLTSALTFTPPSSPLSFTGTTTITLCRSREDVYKALDITTDTQASYGFASASAKFSWAQSQETTSTQLTLVVRALMTSPPLMLSNPRLTQDAMQLLEVGNFQAFCQRYGDRFVSGKALGGEYVALLAIETCSEQDRQTIATTLEAAVSFGELDASVQTTVSNTLNTSASQSSLRFSEFWQGGDPVAAAAAAGVQHDQQLTADAVMSKALHFPATVTSRNAFPIQCVLAEYSELDLPDPQAWLTFQQQFQPVRQRLLDFLVVIQTMRADLSQVKEVLAHPDLYTDTAAEVTSSLSPVATNLQTVIDEANVTAANYAAAVMAAGSAAAVQMPDEPDTISIPWPTIAPAYRILVADHNDWAVSCPQSGDITGPLVLQPSGPADTRQQWQIIDASENAFSMVNVSTGLRALGGLGGPVTQTQADDDTTLWQFVQDSGEVTSPPDYSRFSPSDYSRCFLQPVQYAGYHLNLDDGNLSAEAGILTWNDFAWNSTWTLEKVTALLTTIGPPSMSVPAIAW